MSGGSGASKDTFTPVTGWGIVTRQACSACRPMRSSAVPYTRSPTIGHPRADRWTRIWWVRPVTSSQRTKAPRGDEESTS